MAFVDDLAVKYVAAGVGVMATTLFIGAKPVIPPGVGAFTSIAATGGDEPTLTQQEAPAYRRPSAQVVCRSESSQTARLKAEAAYAATWVFNTTVGASYYLSIKPRQEPFELPLDVDGRVRYAFNIDAVRRA